jgi:hypothetical protein
VNAIAGTFDVDFYPDDPDERGYAKRLRDGAVLVVAVGVGLVRLVAAILLQSAHDALVLAWLVLGAPVVLVANRPSPDVATSVAVDRLRASPPPGRKVWPRL